jgi:hypothetical protein
MTDEEQRLADNEMIARYAGKGFPMGHISDYKNGPLPVAMNKRYLHYHTSWNELIPVVKKVKEDLYRKAEYIGIAAADITMKDIQKKLQVLEIEPLYTATLQAIKLITGK